MKKSILPVLALFLVSFGLTNTGITNEERAKTVAHLMHTQERVSSAVEGLSTEQLNFKPSAEMWSIAECLEHLTLSEDIIGGMLQGALKTPANAAMRDSVVMPDEPLIAMISSRDQKVKTLKPFEPSGKFGSYEETLKAFNTKRKAHIDYIKATKDDLRNHYGQLPFGTIDGLQILLFMSGHTERHVQQMEEVMAHANFPKA